MKIIRTVLADLSPDPLFSHCHEHIWIGKQSLGEQCPVSAIDDEAAFACRTEEFLRGRWTFACRCPAHWAPADRPPNLQN